MHINDPDFMRRRILRGSNEYSPKKRWDQNAFGSERRMLIDHVEKTMKEHENDGDILEKFKKEAQELKDKKRREKFPHLFKSRNSQENLLLQTVKKAPTNYANEFQQPLVNQSPQPQAQPFKQKQSFSRILQPSPRMPQQIPHYPPFTIATPNPFQLQARIQYQRTIGQKDLQLYKKEQKIKRQKKEINRLYKQLKQREREDELEKFVKSHEEIKKMNQMLVDMREEFTSRKSLISNRNDVLVDAHQEADTKRNYSEIYLNTYNSEALVKDHVRDPKNDIKIGTATRQSALLTHKQIPSTPRRSVIPLLKEGPRNPEVQYSPQMKNNRSSVFEKVPLYNPPLLKSNSLNAHLDELKNYNKRLEYFHDYNRSKLSQIS